MKRRPALCLVAATALAGTGAPAQTIDSATRGTMNLAVTAPAATAPAATAPAPPAVPETAAPAASPPPAPASTSRWVVSETRSPVDYSPVAVATASGAEGGLLLSIQCRGGRTEMLIAAATPLRVDEHAVSYAINGGPAVPVLTGPPVFGSGMALKGDIARFLRGLPAQGEIAFAVTSRKGEGMAGRYALDALTTLAERLAAPCRWPARN